MKDVFHPTIGHCYAEKTYFFGLITNIIYVDHLHRVLNRLVLTSNLKTPVMVRKGLDK